MLGREYGGNCRVIRPRCRAAATVVLVTGSVLTRMLQNIFVASRHHVNDSVTIATKYVTKGWGTQRYHFCFENGFLA